MWFFNLNVKNIDNIVVVNRQWRILLSTNSVGKWWVTSCVSLKFSWLMLWYFLGMVNVTYSMDLGKLANTFPIKEISPIEIITAKYNKLTADEKRQHQEKIVSQTKGWIKRPPGLKLPRAIENRSFVFDPSIRISRDIVVDYTELAGYPEEVVTNVKKILGENGRVLVAKGTIVDPLKMFSRPAPLLFFDGDDIEQVEWFKQQDGIAVLTNGEQLRLSREIGRQVSFDQFGLLVKKFGIEHVPAKVSAVNGKLLIQEVAV